MITQLNHSKLRWGVGAVLHKWNAAATCVFNRHRTYIDVARNLINLIVWVECLLAARYR